MSTSQGTATARQHELDEYNYEHFRMKHLLADLGRTMQAEGVRPGQEGPDFDLESTDGQRTRLSSLRGRPVVLHFGSST